MLDRLIRFSLAQRGLVIMLALVVLILGVKKTVETPVDVLPDLTKPTVTLLTEARAIHPRRLRHSSRFPLKIPSWG